MITLTLLLTFELAIELANLSLLKFFSRIRLIFQNWSSMVLPEKMPPLIKKYLLEGNNGWVQCADTLGSVQPPQLPPEPLEFLAKCQPWPLSRTPSRAPTAEP